MLSIQYLETFYGGLLFKLLLLLVSLIYSFSRSDVSVCVVKHILFANISDLTYSDVNKCHDEVNLSVSVLAQNYPSVEPSNK